MPGQRGYRRATRPRGDRRRGHRRQDAGQRPGRRHGDHGAPQPEPAPRARMASEGELEPHRVLSFHGDEGFQASRRMISRMVSATRMAARTRKIPDSMPWKAQYRDPGW